MGCVAFWAGFRLVRTGQHAVHDLPNADS